MTTQFDNTSRKLWGINPSGIWTPINTDANGNLLTSLTGSIPAGTNIIGNTVLQGGTYGDGQALVQANLVDNSGGHFYLQASTVLQAVNSNGGSNYDRVAVINGVTGAFVTPTSGALSVSITTAATTAIKSGPGVIGTLINAGSAVTGAITVYDSTTGSGKIIWSGTLSAGQVLPLGIPCGTAITVVTAAVGTLTVTYA